MITRETWRARMENDMRLRDLRPRTIEGYLLATRLFIERVDKEPEKLTEEDVRGYFLYLRDDKHQLQRSGRMTHLRSGKSTHLSGSTNRSDS